MRKRARPEGAGRETDAEPDLDLVEYVVIMLPDLSLSAAVTDAMGELVDSSRIRVLDLVGVATQPDGGCVAVEPELLATLGQLETVEGEVGGLLSDDDIALACQALPPGTSAVILVAEDIWARTLADSVRAAGGRIVGGERIPRHRLEQSRSWRLRRRDPAQDDSDDSQDEQEST